MTEKLNTPFWPQGPSLLKRQPSDMSPCEACSHNPRNKRHFGPDDSCSFCPHNPHKATWLKKKRPGKHMGNGAFSFIPGLRI